MIKTLDKIDKDALKSLQDVLETLGELAELQILRTPTGPLRNKWTELNIKRLELLDKIDKKIKEVF